MLPIICITILDSSGGSIYSGLSFISLMQSVPQKIHCVALFAASMAHSILQACPGKRYVASNNGVVMIHRAKGMFMGQFNNGEVESQLVFWRKLVGKMEKDNASRMKYGYKYYQFISFSPQKIKSIYERERYSH